MWCELMNTGLKQESKTLSMIETHHKTDRNELVVVILRSVRFLLGSVRQCDDDNFLFLKWKCKFMLMLASLSFHLCESSKSLNHVHLLTYSTREITPFINKLISYYFFFFNTS